MTSFRLFGIIVGIGIFGVSKVFAAPPDIPPVEAVIINDASQAVPVTVQNQVSPPSNITINNDATTPVPVTHAPRPYIKRVSETGDSGTFIVSLSVPKGSILKIEKIAVLLENDPAPLRMISLIVPNPEEPEVGQNIVIGAPVTRLGGFFSDNDGTVVYVDGPYYALSCGGCEGGVADFVIFASFKTTTNTMRRAVFDVSGLLLPAVP